MTTPHSSWHDVPLSSQRSFSYPVTSRADGSIVKLPVIAIRGARPGKTLLAIAGIHGDEFEGPAALQALAAELRPETLAGTLVAIPIANPPAFEAGLRTNPDDRQDLARVFPGDPAGTVSEQIAHALTQSFIRHADFYCDLHSAGQYYAMPALVGYQLRDEPMLSAQRAAARAFGLPIVWGTPGLPGRSLSAAAEHGVPAIYAEITGEGRCRPADVECYRLCLCRLLAHLGIVAGAPPAPAAEPLAIEDRGEGAGFLQAQNRAPLGGFFQSEVAAGQAVRKGQRVGLIRDPFGVVLHEVHATYTGIVVFLRTFPRVLAGDPLCTVLETERA